MVGEGARGLLDRYLVEAVRVEDAAGDLCPGHPVRDGDLEIAGERALDSVLGPEAQGHALAAAGREDDRARHQNV